MATAEGPVLSMHTLAHTSSSEHTHGSHPLGLLPSCGLVSLHSAELETLSRPALRVPHPADRVILNGRTAGWPR